MIELHDKTTDEYLHDEYLRNTWINVISFRLGLLVTKIFDQCTPLDVASASAILPIMTRLLKLLFIQ